MLSPIAKITLGCMLAVTVIGGYGMILPLVSRAVAEFASNDAGFEIVPHSADNVFGASRGFTITYKNDRPIHLNKVIVNGEFECCLGRERGSGVFVPNPDKKLPLKMTIGDQCVVLSNWTQPATIAEGCYHYNGYNKSKLVYLIFDTDRGRFKYKEADGKVVPE
jgi:hypothetical protein